MAWYLHLHLALRAETQEKAQPRLAGLDTNGGPVQGGETEGLLLKANVSLVAIGFRPPKYI